jgi:hypothetical protein
MTGREADDAAGVGQFTLQVLGPVSVCSTHGGGVDIGTSRGPIKLAGTLNGDVTMDTCP